MWERKFDVVEDYLAQRRARRSTDSTLRERDAG